MFFEPGREILVARNGEEVARLLQRLEPAAATEIGTRALQRARGTHEYLRRAEEVHHALQELSRSHGRSPLREVSA